MDPASVLFELFEQAAAMDPSALFEEARRLTKQATVKKGSKVEMCREEALAAAQEKLMRRVLKGLEERVREAALAGQRKAEVYAFEGTERVGGFFTLYLLKGPRRDDWVPFLPLLSILEDRLKPFKVKHHWVEGTLDNKVIVSW